MKKILESLYNLQKVDTELLDLENLMGDLPVQVSRLRTDVDAAEQSQVEKKELLETYRKEHSECESLVKTLEEQKKKYQDQLYQVKTNREYDAVTHEIEAVKEEISVKESRMLELMDLQETLTKEVEEGVTTLEALQKDFKEKTAALEEKMSRSKEDVAQLEEKRQGIVSGIERRYLQNYERIRKGKKGLAVVHIDGNVCSGCSSKLPPQRVLEVREMSRLYICEVCGRMLVYDKALDPDLV